MPGGLGIAPGVFNPFGAPAPSLPGAFSSTTSLLIGTPDIVGAAMKLEPSETYWEYGILDNIRSKNRWQIAQLASATTGNKTIQLDLNPSDTRAAEFVYIARASQLISAGLVTTLLLERSSDGSSWTTTVNDTSFAAATLVGFREQDYLSTWAATSAVGFYKFTFSVSGASQIPLSNIFLGTFLDMGIEPDGYRVSLVENKEGEFIADSGAAHISPVGDMVRSFGLTWSGVTDAKADEFVQKVLNRRDRDTFVLYAHDNTAVLDGATAVHVRLATAERVHPEGVPDWNHIRAQFVELI